MAIFDEMRQGLQQIEFLSKANSGELRVGCPEATAAGLLPVIAEQFARQCPAARLYVVHADTASSHFQELRERRVDLAAVLQHEGFSMGYQENARARKVGG